jgi:hypothetical protein
MGIEARGASQRDTNIFNKIITEIFPNLEKELSIPIQEASRTPNSLTKIEPLHGIILLKQLA